MAPQMTLTMDGFDPDNHRGFVDGQRVYRCTVFGSISAYESALGTFRIIDGQPFIDSVGILIREAKKWHGTQKDAALAAADELETCGQKLIARADAIRANGCL
jgi:hypothetical protein